MICLSFANICCAEHILGWGIQKTDSTILLRNDYIAISAGAYHNLALKSDGSIVGWGDDNYGQATPPTGGGYVAIAAGGVHSFALKTDGSIVVVSEKFVSI